MNKSTPLEGNDQTDSEITEPEEISKSQRKRDADNIRDLGARLTELPARQLATIPLPEEIRSAVVEYTKIKSNSARKRQLGFLAKHLRNVDVEPIDAALEKIRQTARASTIKLHLAEHWRDRLLGRVEEESARDALTTYLNKFPHADRQQLRHLQTQAIKEQQKNTPPAAARELFKVIRLALSNESAEQE